MENAPDVDMRGTKAWSQGLFAAASAEFRLAAFCCGSPILPGRPKELAELLAGGIRWDHLLHLADRHRIAGLLHNTLAGCDSLPPGPGTELARKASKIAMRNLACLPVLRNLASMLEKAGIPFVVLKGLPLGQLAYGNISLRHSKDIDVLIAPEHVPDVQAYLRELSFEPAHVYPSLGEKQARLWRRVRQHHEFVQTGGSARIEIHWRAFENPYLWSPTTASPCWVEVCPGLRLPVLSAEDNLLTLCAHGAGHAWFRLKWLADVAALLAQQDEHFVPGLRELARSRDLLRPLEQTLTLCGDLFSESHVPLRPPISWSTRWLVDVARNALLLEHSTAPSSGSDFVAPGLKRSRLLLRRSWRYRLAEIRCRLASPIDWHTVRLPSHLHFLYPMLRIPLWMWRRRAARFHHNAVDRDALPQRARNDSTYLNG